MTRTIQKHEKTITLVEYDWGEPAITMQEHTLFGTPEDAERSARHHVESGDRNVKLITEVWRWRGKNGKITKERTREVAVS